MRIITTHSAVDTPHSSPWPPWSPADSDTCQSRGHTPRRCSSRSAACSPRGMCRWGRGWRTPRPCNTRCSLCDTRGQQATLTVQPMGQWQIPVTGWQLPWFWHRHELVQLAPWVPGNIRDRLESTAETRERQERDKRETREPHLGGRGHHTGPPSSPRRRYTPPTWDHRLRLRKCCDQVCHLNILVRIFSMRLGLPLPGYCEVMAVTRVTTHIYISLSRRIRIKILFPKLL